MSISSVVTTKEESKSTSSPWLTVPKNSTIKIIPLVDLIGGVSQYKQFKFGKGSDFFTIPYTNELNDPCVMLGLDVPSKFDYIMPVLVYDDDTGEINPEAKYFRFGRQLFDALQECQATIDDTAKMKKNKKLSFKHSLIRITRDDNTPNGFTKYSASWTTVHMSEMVNGKLPESTLDMNKGIFPQVENFDDNSEIRSKIIELLKTHESFVVKDGKTIGQLLIENNVENPVYTETEDNSDSEFESIDKAE